jgi:hypothetical protein
MSAFLRNFGAKQAAPPEPVSVFKSRFYKQVAPLEQKLCVHWRSTQITGYK